jgi:hypothetical protein
LTTALLRVPDVRLIWLRCLAGARCSISDLREHVTNIEARLAKYDRAISEIARDDERSRRLMHLQTQ